MNEYIKNQMDYHIVWFLEKFNDGEIEGSWATPFTRKVEWDVDEFEAEVVRRARCETQTLLNTLRDDSRVGSISLKLKVEADEDEVDDVNGESISIDVSHSWVRLCCLKRRNQIMADMGDKKFDFIQHK